MTKQSWRRRPPSSSICPSAYHTGCPSPPATRGRGGVTFTVGGRASLSISPFGCASTRRPNREPCDLNSLLLLLPRVGPLCSRGVSAPAASSGPRLAARPSRTAYARVEALCFLGRRSLHVKTNRVTPLETLPADPRNHGLPVPDCQLSHGICRDRQVGRL